MLFSTLVISAVAGLLADKNGRTEPPKRRSRRSAARPAPAAAPLKERVIGMIGATQIVAAQEQNSEVVAKVNKHLRAAGMIGGALVASAVVPAAIVAVPALAVWSSMPLVRSARNYWLKNGKPDVYTLGATRFAMLLVSQSYVSLFIGTLMRWCHGLLYLRTKDHSRRLISELFGTQSDTAWLVRDGSETTVAIADLKVGDVVAVQAGDMIPVDGVVVSGAARVDQQMLTGEERPIELFEGERAFAGTQLISGRVMIRAERTGAETTTGRIVAVLNQTTEYRLSTEIRAKQIADNAVPLNMAIGAAVLPFIGLYRTAGFLIALPTAEVLLFTGPMGMLNTLSRAAQRGIVIMDGRTLEMLPEVDTVVFDKTGTLTDPVPMVDRLVGEEGVGENDLLTWAAAAEAKQTHPVALAIRGEAARRGLEVPTPLETDYVPSNGIQARIGDGLIQVGSGRYMDMVGVTLSDRAREAEAGARSLGRPFVFVARDGRIAGTIVLRTKLRPEAHGVIRELKERGLHVRILSGDGRAQTEAAAQELGVDGFDAEVLPHEKALVVQKLRNEGRFVCFVGDGINDLVAMRAAQVSVAVAGATTAANAVAGVMIYDGDLHHIVDMLKIGQLFRNRMSESIMVALVPDSISLSMILFGGGGFMTAVVLGWVSVGTALATFMRPWPEELKSRRKVAPKQPLLSAAALRKLLPRREKPVPQAEGGTISGVLLDSEIIEPAARGK
jgi:Cu2+-exporting ATPase